MGGWHIFACASLSPLQPGAPHCLRSHIRRCCQQGRSHTTVPSQHISVPLLSRSLVRPLYLNAFVPAPTGLRTTAVPTTAVDSAKAMDGKRAPSPAFSDILERWGVGAAGVASAGGGGLSPLWCGRALRFAVVARVSVLGLSQSPAGPPPQATLTPFVNPQAIA